MKIYVACPMQFVSEARRVALYLATSGYVITSRWLLNKVSSPMRDMNDAAKANYATEWCDKDYFDLESADVAVILNPDASVTGGTHVELGIALALRKRIIAIGSKPNVFYYHTSVYYYNSFGVEAQARLATWLATWRSARANEEGGDIA